MSESPAKPLITYDDFAKLDLRVGQIVECTPHPNADKLLLVKVDLGTEQRQIVAGIRPFYDPVALVGRQIIIVANLAPRAMRGFESQGMLLAASTDDRTRVVVLSPSETMPPGAVVS